MQGYGYGSDFFSDPDTDPASRISSDPDSVLDFFLNPTLIRIRNNLLVPKYHPNPDPIFLDNCPGPVGVVDPKPFFNRVCLFRIRNLFFFGPNFLFRLWILVRIRKYFFWDPKFILSNTDPVFSDSCTASAGAVDPRQSWSELKLFFLRIRNTFFLKLVIHCGYEFFRIRNEFFFGFETMFSDPDPVSRIRVPVSARVKDPRQFLFGFETVFFGSEI